MVCRKREIVTAWVIHSAGFRECFLHTTHVNTVLKSSIRNESSCTGSGACNFRFLSEWPSKQQFLQSSPPQTHGFQCRVATLMLSLKLSVNTHLGVKVTASTIYLSETVQRRQPCFSQHDSCYSASCSCKLLNAQLRF